MNMAAKVRCACALAAALAMTGFCTAFAQSEIDELLQALDALQEQESDRSASAVPGAVSDAKSQQKEMTVPVMESGDFGTHARKTAGEAKTLRRRFIKHVQAVIGLGNASKTNSYRYLHRDAGSVERDGRTVTLRARFSRRIRFDSLQHEMDRTVADLERRFADCGFAPVGISGNAYLNYVEDVGGLAVFLYADGGVSADEAAYTMAVSFGLDFLAPNQAEPSSSAAGADVRRDADFGDRKTVEAMLSTLGRSDFIVRKVRYRRMTAGVDLSGGDVSLPVYEERLACEDRTWEKLTCECAGASADSRTEPRQTDCVAIGESVVGLDVREAGERRYEAMKFMNDFIHPCEHGFGWKESAPEVSTDQTQFIRLVREITGRTVLSSDAVPPLETLAEMRRRYHEPTKRLSPTVVDWNVPVNAFRYFPYAPESLSQSPYSSTLFACFSADCTRESVWNEMCALARDIERRFAVCGFKPQEVGDGGYVNYRPNVGGVVIHLLSCRTRNEPVHLMVLRFSTRLFDWRCGSTHGDWKTERLLQEILTQGIPDRCSVCTACVKRRLRDYCGNLDWMKGVPERRWFSRTFELPVYDQRGDGNSGFSFLPRRNWRSVMRPAFTERTVSCFDEAIPLEDLPLDVGAAAFSSSDVTTDADARRSEVADSFYERFLRDDHRAVGSVPDVALCEICRGSSSWEK